jgi:transcriptional regulator GlxA family with amidase domain
MKMKPIPALDRRAFLAGAAAASSLAFVSAPDSKAARENTSPGADRLTPPAKGKVPVAFLISEHATVIDFTGPWEVFQDVMIPSRGASHEEQMPFELFTVAGGPEPVRVSGGMRLTPDHTVENAPDPRVIVVPAMMASDRVLDWLRRKSATADLTMSVCTGAFVLAEAGLLKGRAVTTHHDFQDRLKQKYPDLDVKRGLRFVEGGRLATAGGLTSGIDLALRVVERYFGRDTAEATARYMEYQSRGWVV